jgi:hypothetical protein
MEKLKFSIGFLMLQQSHHKGFLEALKVNWCIKMSLISYERTSIASQSHNFIEYSHFHNAQL